MDSLQTLHKSLTDQEKEYRDKLTMLIKNLPDNREGSSSPRCFTVNISQLECGNLCPQFYDFGAQYKEIIERIDKTRFENIPKTISTIIKEPCYHSEVRQHIKNMWGAI